MNWKKIIAVLVAAVLALPLGQLQARAVSTSAVSTCVIDVDSGRVLYESNADEQRAIASITKIMTGVVALETVPEELDQVCTTSDYAASVGGSSLYLLKGDQITLRSALYGTLLRSGNDCAIVVAEAVAGSEAAFCDLMNEKAAELGMTNTHFSSCNGLKDENNYSTARDMARLGAYAIQNPQFAEICGTWVLTTEDGYWIENHNKLISEDKRCIGIKTGYTYAAGRTLVSCARDPDTGARVVCCTLKDSDDYKEHQAVFDWAFATYTPVTLCTAGQEMTRLTFADGETLPLLAEEDLFYTLQEGEELSCRMCCLGNRPTEGCAPGEEAGYVAYYLNGEEVARTALFYGGGEES